MKEIEHSESLKSAQEKLAEFRASGLSVRRWAQENGFSPALTYRVLAGGNPQRGESHNIAVALGIKAGKIGSEESYAGLTVYDESVEIEEVTMSQP